MWHVILTSWHAGHMTTYLLMHAYTTTWLPTSSILSITITNQQWQNEMACNSASNDVLLSLHTFLKSFCFRYHSKQSFLVGCWCTSRLSIWRTCPHRWKQQCVTIIPVDYLAQKHSSSLPPFSSLLHLPIPLFHNNYCNPSSLSLSLISITRQHGP